MHILCPGAHSAVCVCCVCPAVWGCCKGQGDSSAGRSSQLYRIISSWSPHSDQGVTPLSICRTTGDHVSQHLDSTSCPVRLNKTSELTLEKHSPLLPLLFLNLKASVCLCLICVPVLIIYVAPQN